MKINYRAIQMLEGYADQRKLTITTERLPAGTWRGKMQKGTEEPWLSSDELNPRGYETLMDLFTALHHYAQKKIQNKFLGAAL